MGFGILIIGFFIAYVGAITPFVSFTFVLGSGIIVYSLVNLSTENQFFFGSIVGYTVELVISLVVMIMYLFGKGSGDFYSALVGIQTYLSHALALLLMLGIASISAKVELKHLQARAIINGAFVVLTLIFTALLDIVTGSFAISRLGVIYVICQIIYTFFGLFVIFNAYMRICYEDDKDMEGTSGGFAPFDVLNRFFDRATKRNNNKKDKK